MAVDFNEPKFTPSYSAPTRARALTTLVIRSGFAKDEAGAQKVLLVILGLAVLVMLFIFATSGGEVEPPPPEVFEGMR